MMTERKWTPGPWEAVDLDSGGCFSIQNMDGDVVVEAGAGYFLNIGRDEQHLIASAPDLYEALEGARDIMSGMGMNTAYEDAALACARGEA